MLAKQSKPNQSTKTRRHALMAALVLSSIPMTIVGCKSTQTGRCGLPDLCEPIVVRDPFPNDVGVPCKGVDAENAGYYRPRWRVLNGPTAECCAAGQCAPITQLGEVTQKPATNQSPQSVQLPQAMPSKTALAQPGPAPQTYSESMNRVSAIPVSMTNGLEPLSTVDSATSLSENRNPYSTEIDPIVLPAPLPAPVSTTANLPLPAPQPVSPLSGVELAPVLTR